MANNTKFAKADPAIVPVEGPAAAQAGPAAGKRERFPGSRVAGDAGRGALRSAQDDNERQKRADASGSAESKAPSPSGATNYGVNSYGVNSYGANTYGVNNEQLPERLQEALRRLVFRVSHRVGAFAAAGDPPDQAGAPILARLAIFVVGRARPELALAVRAEADGQLVAGGSAALRVRHEYLPGVRAVADRGAFAGRAARAILSLRRRRRKRMWRRPRRRRKWRRWSSGTTASGI